MALRETRRRVGRVPAFTVVDSRQPGGNWGSVAASGIGEDIGARDQSSVVGAQRDGSADIGDLRADEIERLLTENARLNQRIVFLLKVIERDQAREATRPAEQAATETDRGTIARELRTAIEAELRPFLLVLLRLLEKLRADQASLTDGGTTALWPAAVPARDNIRLAGPEATLLPAASVTARSMGSSR